jgi:excisionase family DNA binding protein
MPAIRLEPGRGKDLLTGQEVADRLSISVRTLYRLVAGGQFPRPIRFSRKLVRWKADDVRRHLDALSAAS